MQSQHAGEIALLALQPLNGNETFNIIQVDWGYVKVLFFIFLPHSPRYFLLKGWVLYIQL